MNIYIKTIHDYLQKQEDAIGSALFLEGINNQIVLFEKFGVCTQNNLSLKSEITNHYTEENYWINDHWAINPPQYTVSGLIGELIYTVPTGWAKKIESLYSYSGLGLLSVISPVLGSYTSSVLNITRKVQSVVDKYSNIAKKAFNQFYNFLNKNNIKKTNQRKVLDTLESIMNNRQLVTVVTPYGTYNNLAIIAINIRQDQDSKYVSNLEVTFQKWRSVEEYTKDIEQEKLNAEITGAQKANVANKGLVGTIKSKININDLGSNFTVA